MQATKESKKKYLPFKRRNSYWAHPEDLYLERDPSSRHYDPRVNLPPEEKTVRGIMKHGVLEDVIVEKDGDLVVVVDGRGRVIAAMEANRRLEEEDLPPVMIPVSPRRGTEVDLFEVGVIANDHRRKDGPITQAYKMQRYLDRGFDDDAVAELWGCNPKTVRRRVGLLDLCKAVQEAVEAGRISAERALRLRGLSAAEQVRALESRAPAAPKRPTRKRVREAIGVAKVPDAVRAALEWSIGAIGDDQFASRVKSMSFLGEGGE